MENEEPMDFASRYRRERAGDKREEWFERLTESALESARAGRVHLKAIVAAIDRNQEVTFWELLAAAMNVGVEHDPVCQELAAVFESVESGKTGTQEAKAELQKLYDSARANASAAKSIAAEYTELAENIEANAAAFGFDIVSEVRTEAWRRLDPRRSDDDEGLRR